MFRRDNLGLNRGFTEFFFHQVIDHLLLYKALLVSCQALALSGSLGFAPAEGHKGTLFVACSREALEVIQATFLVL